MYRVSAKQLWPIFLTDARSTWLYQNILKRCFFVKNNPLRSNFSLHSYFTKRITWHGPYAWQRDEELSLFKKAIIFLDFSKYGITFHTLLMHTSNFQEKLYRDRTTKIFYLYPIFSYLLTQDRGQRLWKHFLLCFCCKSVHYALKE